MPQQQINQLDRLADENELVVVYMPAMQSFYVFRVKEVLNKYRENLQYGLAPITTTTQVQGITPDDSPTNIPAPGVLPARAQIKTSVTFPLPTTTYSDQAAVQNAFDNNDMWMLDYSDRDHLFHYVMDYTPSFLRMDVEIPQNARQGWFQNGRIPMGVDQPWGYFNGRAELVHFPKIHYGFKWANDTSIDMRMGVNFKYREYIVEMYNDPERIFNIMTRRDTFGVHWITLPFMIPAPSVTTSLTQSYGFTGLPLMSYEKKADAIAQYKSLLAQSLITVAGQSR